MYSAKYISLPVAILPRGTMISHPFTQPLDPLQCFIRKLNRLEETFSVSPLSELEQEGAVRRMRFAVDAGLKAMKDHLATSGHLPDVPTPPAVAEADHL